MHRLHAHSSLIESGEGSYFDLGLRIQVFFQAELRVGRVTRVPEVVSCILDLHVDAIAGLSIVDKLVLILESKQAERQ